MAVAFEADAAALRTFRVARSLDPHALCAAVLADGEAARLRDAWPADDPQPLLIVRCSPPEAKEIVEEIVAMRAHQAMALLLAGTLTDSWLNRVWNRFSVKDWVNHLAGLGRDVQVHIYDPSWASRPPRVR